MSTSKRFVTKNGLDNNGNSIANLGVSGSSLTMAGANALTLTTTGPTNITFPTSGTLATTAGSTTTAINLSGGVAGNVPYQSAANTTGFITNGTGVLVAASSGATPAWTTSPTLTQLVVANTSPALVINANTTGNNAYLQYQSVGVNRWEIYKNNTAESGSNVGSDLFVGRFSDAGAFIDAPLTITRSTGLVTLNDGLTVVGTATATTFSGPLSGNATSATTATNIAGGTTGNIHYQSAAGTTAFVTNAAGVLQAASSGATPTWTTTPTLTGTNFTGIPNTGLTNSSVTIGSTAVSLGGTATTLAGLTSVTSTTFVGALTGHASSDLALTGGSMTGTITMDGTHTVTGLPAPVNGTDAVTKNYVDSAITGLEWKQSVAAATTANLTATYSNGTSGVGATLTNSGTQAAFVVDGYSAALNDRILVKNQTTQFQNGIYTVTTVGSVSTNWVLTRAVDADTSSELSNATTYVINGTTLADTGWTQITANPTIGTSNVVFNQFSGSGTYTAGTGLSLTGNTFANTGVLSVTTNTGLSSNVAATGAVTITNTGVTSNVAGTGISVSGATGAVTITNSGVTSAVAGTNIAVSGATGAVTISVTGTVPSATNATNATNATLATTASNVAITGSSAVASTFYVPFVGANSSSSQPLSVTGAFNFNPSTGVLSSTSFTGAGTGLTGTAASLNIGGSAGLNVLKTGDTMTGKLTMQPTAGSETVRVIGDGNYLAFWNTANSTRNGYLQSNTGSGFALVAENGSALQLGVGSSIKANLDTSGNFNVTAGVSTASLGFQTPTYITNSRNRIWSFGNADGYGISYFQGTSGLSGADSLGFHFGTATSAASTFNISNTAGTFTVPVTATSFSGAGTGLTGTAGSLNIGGNAATATVATRSNWMDVWDGTSAIAGTNALSSSGSRSVSLAPNTYAQQISWEFKNAALFGTAGNYSGLLTLAPWQGTSASTGDPSYQMLFSPTAANSTSPPNIYVRAGIDTTWGSFVPLLHSSNYNAYSSFTGKITTSSASTGAGSASAIWANGGDITAARSSTQGVLYLGTGGNNYLYWDGTNYNMPNGGLTGPTSITSSGDVTAFSDIRIKDNIVVINNALSKVEKLRGVTFTRIDDAHFGEKQTGVIAQEVQEVLPEVVHENEDGMLSVAYGNMVGLLIESIKELSAQNRSLLARIEILEGK